MEIYKITDVVTKNYYIGMNRNGDKNYFGSGTWIKEQAKIFSGLKKIPNSAKSYHFKSHPNRFIKTILFETKNIEKLYEMEKLIIGNLWKEDPYCMNKMCGGYCPPIYRGNEHPKYDHTKIQLYNIENNETINITQNDFNTKFSNGNDSIRKIINNGQYKGWVLFKNRNKMYGKNKFGEHSPNFDNTTYKFINLISLEIFNGTRTDFKMKYNNLNSKSVNNIITGFNIIYNNWCLYDNIDSVKNKSTYETYKFIKNEEVYVGFRKDFSKLYGVKLGSVNALCNGQVKVIKGWKILQKYTIMDRIALHNLVVDLDTM